MRNDPNRLGTKIVVLATISIAQVSLLIALDARAPVVVYNASGSAPLGFYRVESRPPERGDTVIVQPSPAIALMIAARGILPLGVPLVKQVAAVAGDEVCRSRIEGGGVVSINGKVVAETFDNDRDGRPLPAWEGCMTLVDGEVFLLQPHPYSFDSRYFGPVLRCDILGVARPLWTWNPDM